MTSQPEQPGPSGAPERSQTWSESIRANPWVYVGFLFAFLLVLMVLSCVLIYMVTLFVAPPA